MQSTDARQMTRWGAALGCAWLLAGCADGPESMSLDELIARHTKARGGAEAIESVRAIEIELTIAEPSYQADGRYVATRDGRMRIDVAMDGQDVFAEGLDGRRSWSWSPDKVADSEGSEQGTAALRHGVEFPFKLYGLHEMRGRGHRLELLGRQRVDDTDYYKLQLTLDDGFQVQYFLNPNTWLIERERQLRALHVDIDPKPQWIEIVFSDYRPVGGVQFPYQQVERNLESGELLMTTTLTTIRINPVLDAARFSAH
jgi:hypothetical protein